jgi:hypothetical protein
MDCVCIWRRTLFELLLQPAAGRTTDWTIIVLQWKQRNANRRHNRSGTQNVGTVLFFILITRQVVGALIYTGRLATTFCC